MSTTIRTFRNTDVNSICSVWNAHHAEFGPECKINPLRFELSCLAKPYFREADVIIAQRKSRVVGWTHISGVASEDLADESQDVAAIAAICVEPDRDEDAIAAELLQVVDERLTARQISRCSFRPLLPNCTFYLGSGQAGSLIGITAEEVRTGRWLAAAGYRPSTPTNSWELNLSNFQPPVNRIQVQIRRSAQVHREVDEPLLPWWQACVLGHTEPTAFQLTHRTEKRVMNEVLFWTVAPELRSQPDSIAWLWPPVFNPQDESDLERMVFLIAESLREMQSERLDLVRTTSAASDVATNALYRRLGFSTSQSGIVFEKVVPDFLTNVKEACSADGETGV
ncbi:MAG: hypothetical protein KDB22_05620 [Planctomycetales bacterium]|nr:hypothetical protein [Planctomycetales bacterium]